MKIKVGVIGATGYAGLELVRLILRHPHAELTAISSVSFEGRPLFEVYPSMREICGLTCGSSDEVIASCDVVFAALPHGLSQDTAAECVKAGKKFIDLGADFRLDDSERYAEWYGCEFKYPELHRAAVYGIPELFREDIKASSIIGNPGAIRPALRLVLPRRCGRVWLKRRGLSSIRNPV